MSWSELKQKLFRSICKGSLLYLEELFFSTNINVGPRLCLSFTFDPAVHLSLTPRARASKVASPPDDVTVDRETGEWRCVALWVWARFQLPYLGSGTSTWKAERWNTARASVWSSCTRTSRSRSATRMEPSYSSRRVAVSSCWSKPLTRPAIPCSGRSESDRGRDSPSARTRCKLSF